MRRIVRSVVRRLKGARVRLTHPYIRASQVFDVSHIDPSARISHSSLVGPVTLGRGTIIDDCNIRANRGVSVGAHSILSGPIKIVADLNPIEIGKFCSIAPYVVIWESLHCATRLSTSYIQSELLGGRFQDDVQSKGAIRIGNDVWIGVHSAVLSGVDIGDGAIIGAGSVVVSDIPAYAIAVGSPARVVKQRFPKPVVERLGQIRWWDWDIDKIRDNRRLFKGDLTLDLLDQVADAADA